MKCPFCLHENTRVLDTRDISSAIRRRRMCEKCKKRFTTYERTSTELVIIKKDGRRESFDREKLKKGVLKACEKRPINREIIESLIDDIETKLRNRGETEIKSSVVGELVMERLKKLDKIAYIRFASVYRSFKDIRSFEKEIKKLKSRKRR